MGVGGGLHLELPGPLAGHGGDRHWRGLSPYSHSVGRLGTNTMNKHMAERDEKDKQNGLCTMNRGGTGDAKAERNSSR